MCPTLVINFSVVVKVLYCMRNISSEKKTSIVLVMSRCGYVGQPLSVRRERKYLTEHIAIAAASCMRVASLKMFC